MGFFLQLQKLAAVDSNMADLSENVWEIIVLLMKMNGIFMVFFLSGVCNPQGIQAYVSARPAHIVFLYQ